jgi:Arc/MetJ family transcription regulator
MRITLDLDRELLERARDSLGVSTFTEAIEVALRRAVEQEDAAAAWSELKGSDLSWESVDDLLEYRARFGGRSS